MSLYEKIISKQEKIAVIGMGYVGMPIAVALSEKTTVIGFDINKDKIEQYVKGCDPTQEVGDHIIQNSSIEFTSNHEKLSEAMFHIVAVPTPINADKTPDLYPIENASQMVGMHLRKGAVVVFESTVYPGVTEDICIPILEKASQLKCGVDFKVGYSPERINPGDKQHRLETITKIVSGTDEEALNEIAQIYELVIKAGVHRTQSIKVAEAAKVAENAQRDINIAFMNELAIVFDKMGIHTQEVLDAMNTKWNALRFSPGLVGGHCIGVDPYYFIYQAENLGYHSQIILSGRKINDSMGQFIAETAINKMIHANKKILRAKVAILGLTFKEDCPDTRNSKVIDIIEKFREYYITPLIVDPAANKAEVQREYGLTLSTMEDLVDIDCIVLAVAHESFKKIPAQNFRKYFSKRKGEKNVIIDVKSVFKFADFAADPNTIYWSL